MNELKEEIKKNVATAQASTNKFAEDPLWESQAWFLRTRLKFGNDYQQFWEHTQGQINDYVTDLNSEDQQLARKEVAESFTLALKSGFDDCNKQIDSLLQNVFQVKQIENGSNDKEAAPKQLENEGNAVKKELEIISLVDVEDEESVNRRMRVDPPSKNEIETKVDPEPSSQENNSATTSIVAILEESITEDEDLGEKVNSEFIDVVDKDVEDDDAPIVEPRNDRLKVALAHRSVEPEITSLVLEEPFEEPIEEAIEVIKETIEEIIEQESPEVIDLTNEAEEIGEDDLTEAVEEIEDVEEIGESLVGQDSRDDDEPALTPPSHSRGLSLTQILLDTYNEETAQDTPERSIWYSNNTSIDMALTTIVSRDTEDEDEEGPTIQTSPSKSKDVLSALFGRLSSATPLIFATQERAEDVNEGREGANDSGRVGADARVGADHGGSRMEPIDLTQEN